MSLCPTSLKKKKTAEKIRSARFPADDIRDEIVVAREVALELWIASPFDITYESVVLELMRSNMFGAVLCSELTFAEIGYMLGVTRERVRQIMDRFNVKKGGRLHPVVRRYRENLLDAFKMYTKEKEWKENSNEQRLI